MRTAELAPSKQVREQIVRPSPIRQIMKMAEPQNIKAMGLDPNDVISFGGGWVNHPAPEPLRKAYSEISADPAAFHRSGGYTATLGDLECRVQLARFEAHLFNVPRLGPENVAIGAGSTQLTLDLFRALIDPGDTVLLMDPTYANYEGQLTFAVPDAKIARLRVLDSGTWSYIPVSDPDRSVADFHRAFDAHRPRLILFGAPDNPTSQILPDQLVTAMQERAADAGSWVAIDFAYKCQLFATTPAYYSWSPSDYPNVIGIHSNSKWGRGLGRRLGWITATPPIIDAIERVQQCSLLCADTLSQMAMTRYLTRAIEDGSLRSYVAEANELYREAARVTVAAIDDHLSRPRLDPMGGLYSIVDIGTSAEEFVVNALQATGVLVVPGAGFGPSLANGIRISYGPLVLEPDKIREGIARLGRWASRQVGGR